MDGLSGSAGRKIAGGVTLPVLALTAQGFDFETTIAPVDGPEGSARLDGPQRPGVRLNQQCLGCFVGVKSGAGCHDGLYHRGGHSIRPESDRRAFTEQRSRSPGLVQ